MSRSIRLDMATLIVSLTIFFLFVATEFWEKLSFVNAHQPMPRAQSTAFIFSQFTTRAGTVHYMGLPEQGRDNLKQNM